MPRRILRQFTLLDAMILVGAAAASLSALRSWIPLWELWPDPRFRREDAFNRGVPYLPLILPNFAVALNLIRLRRPRPPCRLLFRQAGFQAGLAVVFAAIVWFLQCGPEMRRYLDPPWDDPSGGWLGLTTSYIHDDFPGIAGPSVAMTWLTAYLLGRRRSERSWIDRAGRAIGWAWIAVWIVNQARLFCV